MALRREGALARTGIDRGHRSSRGARSSGSRSLPSFHSLVLLGQRSFESLEFTRREKLLLAMHADGHLCAGSGFYKAIRPAE